MHGGHTEQLDPIANLDAEENVLGAMMLDQSAIERVLATGLEAGDFYRESHRTIYRAILTLHELRRPVDAILVRDRILELSAPAEHAERLHELALLTPATSNVARYADLVLEASRRQRLDQVAKNVERRIRERVDVDEITELAVTEIEEVANRTRRRSPTIATIAEFIDDEEEQPEALAGELGETLLPAGGFLLLGGEGGSSKTTLTLDAVAHLASGTTWLGYRVERPLRILIVENEGPRPQFRAKLREKLETWRGDDWSANVHVWAEPWASFSFARAQDRRHLRAAAADLQIDLVIADPLDSLGIEGAGTPEDVRAFVRYLRECGMHDPTRPLAFWLLHHFNKSRGSTVVQQLSGAWGGHPDAILGVELGDGQTTLIRWGKLRHSTPPKQRTTVLQWDVGSRGFTALEGKPETPDAVIAERIRDHLARQTEPQSRNQIEKSVEGKSVTIRRILETMQASRDVTTAPGKRSNVTYYMLSDRANLTIDSAPVPARDEQESEPRTAKGLASVPDEHRTSGSEGASLPGSVRSSSLVPLSKRGDEDEDEQNGHQPTAEEIERLAAIAANLEPDDTADFGT